MVSLSLLAVAALSAAEPKATQSPATPRAVTVVALGDSITKGVRSGVQAEETFAALLETQLQQAGRTARVINVGVGGERTDQAVQRLPEILELQPDIVTVMYGTNDSYVDAGESHSRLTVDEYRSHLERIVTELLRRGVLPVLMTEPRWSDDAAPNGVGENPNLRLENYVVACREIAHKWHVPLVDHFAHWTDARQQGINLREWTTDGCHPNPSGHRELAELMLPALQRAIAPELAVRQKLWAGQSLRVVCFGDSVTGVYYHTGSRRAYSDMLAIALNRIAPQSQVEVLNAGISGHTTIDALERLERDVIDRKPDLVTVMFGLNDMTRVPLDTYRANLETIISRCRAAGMEVLLATPNDVINTSGRPTEKLVEYCDVVRGLGSQLGVPVCDVYRELEATRAQDAFAWKLLMSDEIHPNMDGHKRIATALAQTISGQRVALDDVAASPALARATELLRDGKTVHVLAMPPFDQLIAPALREFYPEAQVTTESWKVEGLSLVEIEHDAQSRVRQLQPDLVVIAVPDSATAASDDEFVRSYSWIMNWSLNFGPPTWDCLVVHPSVVGTADRNSDHDELIRRLVRAQDLCLIDGSRAESTGAADILTAWLRRNLDQR